MTAYDFVHLTLLAMGGEIQGRTKLQKTVYFLGILTGSIDELDYRPHYYGPYSDAVAAASTLLRSRGFAAETTSGCGAIGSGGFEIARHDLKLTPDGTAIASQKASRNPQVWAKMKAAVDRFKTAAGDLDYMRMSVAAKTYFMLSESGEPATSEELAESARKLGWKPSPSEIDEAISFLERMELVKTAPTQN